MLVSSPRRNTRYGSYHSASRPTSGQVTPGNQAQLQSQSQSQPSQSRWLLGNLEVPAPPAVWARYPNKPYIEEFVPPNPPQALGEGKQKMLAWPTAAVYHNAPMYAGVGDTPQDGHDGSSPMGYQSFFRRQMLKQGQEASEDAELKFESGSPVTDNNIHQDISQEFRDLFELDFGVDQRSPSTGTTSGDSYHARSSDTPTSLGKRQRGRINRLPPGYSTQTVMVHVQNSKTGRISSTYRDCDLPDNLSLQLPRLIQPSDPAQLQATLLKLTPMIVYAEFLCPDVCRTRGICIHFSFVLGCKKAPDGLICQVCRAKGNEKAVHAERMCARHNSRKFASFTVNLAEDILATEAQSVRAHEILARSLTTNWDGVPARTERKGKEVVDLSQNSSPMPIRTVNRHVDAADCDIAVCSIEPIHEDEKQVAKKVKVNGRDEETKHDGSTYSKDNYAAQVPTTMQPQLMFDDAYAADLKAFMDEADQGFDTHGPC